MVNDIMVSVSMITYKHEQYIQQAIEGVLMQQTDFNYELIIADDCSPDNTEEIVKNIIQTHPNGHVIKYFRHETNIGMQPNGTFAGEQCKGKYIAICEGDDYWIDPLKLQKQVDFLEANADCFLCFHSVLKENMMTHKKIEIKPNRIKRKYTIKDVILGGGGFIPTNSMVFLSSKIANMPTWAINCPVGDLPLALILAYEGNIGFIAKTMAIYRENSSASSWSSTQKFWENRQRHFDQIQAMWNSFDSWSNRQYSFLVWLKKTKNSLNKKKGDLKRFFHSSNFVLM